MPSYLHIAEKRSKVAFTEEQRQWQLVRRGRCKSRHTRHAATHTATHTLQHTLQHTHCNTHTATHPLQRRLCNTQTATRALQRTHCNTHTATHILQHTHCNTHAATHITSHVITSLHHVTHFLHIYTCICIQATWCLQRRSGGSNSRGVADVTHVKYHPYTVKRHTNLTHIHM